MGQDGWNWRVPLSSAAFQQQLGLVLWPRGICGSEHLGRVAVLFEVVGLAVPPVDRPALPATLSEEELLVGPVLVERLGVELQGRQAGQASSSSSAGLAGVTVGTINAWRSTAGAPAARVPGAWAHGRHSQLRAGAGGGAAAPVA